MDFRFPDDISRLGIKLYDMKLGRILDAIKEMERGI
jgi:hypothetical protein